MRTNNDGKIVEFIMEGKNIESILGRRGAVVKGVEHISTNLLVNI